MNFKLNLFGKSTSNNKAKETLELDLPYSLYPLYVTSASFEGEVQADYDIDLVSIIPDYIAKDFEKYKIELSIAKPHVFITYDEEKGIYRYNLVEPHWILVHLRFTQL